ncbi:hypothetical protein M3936_14315 [Sutcliffiella horikoshii]|uniref:hypothetical protein n=1 Tax=Sutcliffiella horikoshii TaxID=79883 RepID=UPI00203DCE2F|nr:hypothetical protein [Sutcliffiella horikoshii]MCM3618761.1 hypothetical protein [Sutcliffiella horikoshii]
MMKPKIEVGDTIRNPENGLVGVLKKEEDRENYYVEGTYGNNAKWQTAGGSLKDYRKWDLMRKAPLE